MYVYICRWLCSCDCAVVYACMFILFYMYVCVCLHVCFCEFLNV